MAMLNIQVMLEQENDHPRFLIVEPKQCGDPTTLAIDACRQTSHCLLLLA